MANIAGKAYALTVISPIAFPWLNRWIYGLLRTLPTNLARLVRLNIIHFARWVILPADRWPGLPDGWRTRNAYLLFTSNFNHTWDAYLDEFSDILAVGLDLFWYRGIGFPKSVPSSPFKAYIERNSLDSGYFYNATPFHSVRDIGNSFRLREAVVYLEDFLERVDAEQCLSEAAKDAMFEREFNRVAREVQNCLPTLGPAPLANADAADIRRRHQQQIKILEALVPPLGFPQIQTQNCAAACTGKSVAKH